MIPKFQPNEGIVYMMTYDFATRAKLGRKNEEIADPPRSPYYGEKAGKQQWFYEPSELVSPRRAPSPQRVVDRSIQHPTEAMVPLGGVESLRASMRREQPFVLSNL
jgi:hypothetical protein